MHASAIDPSEPTGIKPRSENSRYFSRDRTQSRKSEICYRRISLSIFRAHQNKVLWMILWCSWSHKLILLKKLPDEKRQQRGHRVPRDRDIHSSRADFPVIARFITPRDVIANGCRLLIALRWLISYENIFATFDLAGLMYVCKFRPSMWWVLATLSATPYVYKGVYHICTHTCQYDTCYERSRDWRNIGGPHYLNRRSEVSKSLTRSNSALVRSFRYRR